MSSATDIQALLRFLSQDAKVPLPTAIGKVKELQKLGLTSGALIAKSEKSTMDAIFQDEKLVKQILSAAKRVSKKRSSDAVETLTKRKKVYDGEAAMTPAAIEESLALPEASVPEDELKAISLITNRAPLVLAFAVTLLKYTMPDQPLSSRLSLAQAVVSVNSRSKAVSLGLEHGKSAEEDGWGHGQPKVRIMGRDIRVLKRWGYDSREGVDERFERKQILDDSQDTVVEDPKDQSAKEPALWGLDLEALRSSNGPLGAGAHKSDPSGLPVYTAQSARAYLLKSFSSATSDTVDQPKGSPSKKKSITAITAEKERNLALLLRVLDLLYGSWAHVLSKTDLDHRSWTWYVNVRPEVKDGVAGWGGKNTVKLCNILQLRRKG